MTNEVHPGEQEEKEALAVPPLIQKKRKRFIPKEPLILGPFFGPAGEGLPELIKASMVQFVAGQWAEKDPFAGYLEAVFGHLVKGEDPKVIKDFPESLLPSLIKVSPSVGLGIRGLLRHRLYWIIKWQGS